MKTVDVVYRHHGRIETYLFRSDESAESAYRILKEALSKHQPFNNDLALVSFEGLTGEVTVRVDDLVCVSVGDTTKSEPEQLEWARFTGRIRRAAKIAEAGA